MAALIFYGSGSVAAWFIGKNIVSRAANGALDLLLNSNANDIIKDPNAVRSITGLLQRYRDIPCDHVAYEAMLSVRESMKKLTDTTEQAKLRREVHQLGYLSRWRTYNASIDNKKIEVETDVLLTRLEIFTNLLQYSPVAIDNDPSREHDHDE